VSREYLTLCRDLVAELGVAGGTGPASTVGQVGELNNIIRWVAEADLYVHNLWLDWTFLWTKATGQLLAPEEDMITSLTNLETEVEDGLILHSGTAQAYRPQWLSWPEFRKRFETAPRRKSSRPAAWTVRPDKVIVLSEAVSAETPWSLEYHRSPIRLANNGDLSAIPVRFERIIIARAAIMYGVREDAPEIVTGFAAEYADTLEKMEAFYCPGFRSGRRAQNNGVPAPDFLGG
jgi:hypothetical protein